MIFFSFNFSCANIFFVLHNTQLNGSYAFESHTCENIDIVRDVIIFHCCSVRLLSAQNQRVAYKLASREYLGCKRDQPMPGPFEVGSQVETRGSNSAFFEEYPSYKSRNSSSEIMFSS